MKHNARHMTKLAAMSIYGKNTLEIHWADLMKLGMKHQRPKPIIVCTNYDLGLTFTYFMARSNNATYP